MLEVRHHAAGEGAQVVAALQQGDDAPAGMALRDVEHDRARLEQAEIALFVGRNLPERMQRQMGGMLPPGMKIPGF